MQSKQSTNQSNQQIHLLYLPAFCKPVASARFRPAIARLPSGSIPGLESAGPESESRGFAGTLRVFVSLGLRPGEMTKKHGSNSPGAFRKCAFGVNTPWVNTPGCNPKTLRVPAEKVRGLSINSLPNPWIVVCPTSVRPSPKKTKFNPWVSSTLPTNMASVGRYLEDQYPFGGTHCSAGYLWEQG